MTHDARSNKPQPSALKQRREFAGANCGEIAGDRAPHFFGRTDLNRHGFSGRGGGSPTGCRSSAVLRRCTGRCAVDEVAHNRVPHGCGMSSDLVGASRLDGPFHQRGAPCTAQLRVPNTWNVDGLVCRRWEIRTGLRKEGHARSTSCGTFSQWKAT